MTELEVKFLEYQGYCPSQIKNWNDNTDWDFRESDNFEYWKDGYEQGQIETSNSFHKDLDCYGKKIMSLIKENEELKAQIKPLEDRLCELRRKNASLENKVGKMKCYWNCKNGYSDCCTLRLTNCEKCDKWELYE